MEDVFKHLLILMVVVWTVAVVLRRIGLPTILGELVAGVILGPAILGWVHPSEIIDVLAHMGIFFLTLHTGVTTEPREFFRAMKSSLGVALVGALVPFLVCMFVSLAFGLSWRSAIFVGLTMTATAVVVTLKIFRDLGMDQQPLARLVMAASVVDDMLSLLLFSLVLSLVRGEAVDVEGIFSTIAKVTFFFAIVISAGRWFYPWFKHPFQNRDGKGFTFVLILGLTFGLFAEAIGLHMIVGAYLAGLFFREEVAHPALIQKVEDRLYGISYSFLGPIFFISLGFNITFDALAGPGLWFLLTLTGLCVIGQVLSAGGMALRVNFNREESLTVGVGMLGRGEMALVLASLGLTMGVLDQDVFSILVFTTFLMNIFAIIGLKACAILLKKKGMIQVDEILPKSKLDFGDF